MPLFFYFYGQHGNYQTTVGYWDPRTFAGARTLYVDPGEHASPRACPEGIRPCKRVNLTVEPVVTFRTLEHPDLQAAFMKDGEPLRAFLGHPVNDAAFAEALSEYDLSPPSGRRMCGLVSGSSGMGGCYGRDGQPGPA
jgi:hypothetical protein